jgi:hypothetical protein
MAAKLVLLIDKICEVRRRDGLRWHDIYKVSNNIRFCLKNLKCCNIGVTGARDLGSIPLKWTQVA